MIMLAMFTGIFLGAGILGIIERIIEFILF